MYRGSVAVRAVNKCQLVWLGDISLMDWPIALLASAKSRSVYWLVTNVGRFIGWCQMLVGLLVDSQI